MSKSIFETNDLKGITTVSVYSMIETLAQQETAGKRNSIIFLTSSATIQAEEILRRDDDFSEESNDEKVFPDYALQIALNSRDETLKEYKNDQLLSQQTTFILKNVKIRPFGVHGVTNLPIMLLFSGDIIGLAFGQLD